LTVRLCGNALHGLDQTMVALRCARLVLGWVTLFGLENHVSM